MKIIKAVFDNNSNTLNLDKFCRYKFLQNVKRIITLI